MKKLKGNLYDYLFGPKKPKMMEMTMSDYSKLMSLINSVAKAHKDAQAEIATLKVAVSAKDGIIKSLKNELANDAVEKVEMEAVLEGLLPKTGGSMSGVDE